MIADTAMGDNVDADERMAKTSLNAMEAIPYFGMGAGGVEMGYDAVKGQDATEHALTRRFVEDSGDERDPEWAKKQEEWRIEEHGVDPAKHLTLPDVPTYDEQGNPQCIDRSAP